MRQSRKKKRGMKQKVEITDQILQQVETMAGYGMPMVMIAGVVGISRSAMFNYMKRDPRLREAVESGKARAAGAIGEALFNKALDGDMRAIQWWEATRMGISPNTPLRDEHIDEGVDLTKLSDEELQQLEHLMTKASESDIEGEFEEE